MLFAPDAPGLNDLFTDAAGRVFCGTMRSDPFSTEGPRTDGECWRIDAEGQATELYDGVALTNGLGLSADGSVLYHADTMRGVWTHDLAADGSVANRRLFLDRTSCDGGELMPDGLAIDESDNVWVADVSGSGAARCFNANGDEIARVAVPSTMVTSVSFGGADRRDLYIVTGDNTDDPARRGTIFRTRVDVPGCVVAHATV